MYFNAEQVTDALPWKALIDALDVIFTRDVQSPIRHHHHLKVSGDPDATLLLMPAWIENRYLGVKQVNVFPGNTARREPGLTGHYLLSCARTGKHLAQFEANELTSRRTAAASALASRYLSHENSAELLMVGAGRMARRLVPAHASVRPIKRVRVWDLYPKSAAALVEELIEQGYQAELVAADGLQQAVSEADIISCATLSQEPLIRGEWLTPGTHVDLVGSFTPYMREADDEVMRRGHVFVDTRAGALAESGDLIDPIKSGVISESDVLADFYELCGMRHLGRSELNNPNEAVTVFKAVGASSEDLAAAITAYERSCN
ncbi:ornithine cyclodeaminase family protein [Halomonas titanicae]|uniref:ornithine cyclodeaminase family protein n=1 Tax=Halomonadaceae TaxID=28256 RepID=UPI00048633DE|nr:MULTISPECIES: ornithine cyclodeaminase family protein [Halomonas]MAO49543.1 ornithine cyclodeaminase [Pusillimonas sp.]MCE7520736.1 ornithine cyclodeaminase family protein [Halomonas titanicae]|tara:strand:+ start:5912 stop:6868 length:957 start_codon:yes stop_codon:yes gene_type:complete